jgi:hypothetical protein
MWHTNYGRVAYCRYLGINICKRNYFVTVNWLHSQRRLSMGLELTHLMLMQSNVYSRLNDVHLVIQWLHICMTQPASYRISKTLHIWNWVEPSGQDHLHSCLSKSHWIYHRAKTENLATWSILSANTGYVGFRIPQNLEALNFLTLCGVPVGAPSANIFSHVSPTSPIHVFNDFYDQPIYIIDGPTCQNGIESTVVKIVESEIRILRRGSLSLSRILTDRPT